MCKNDINITGDRNNVGDGNNSGDTYINSQVNNATTLKDSLLQYGIEQADIDELLHILKIEKLQKDARQPGDYALTWINKILKKAKEGTGNISLGITASILAQLIMKYFGIVP